MIGSRAVDHAGRRHICWFRDIDLPRKVGEEEEAAHFKNLILSPMKAGKKLLYS